MNPPADITASSLLAEVQDLLTPPRHVVRNTATLQEAAERLLQDPSSSTVHVVNLNGRLLGILPFARVQRALHARAGVRAGGVGGLLEGLRDGGRLGVEDVMVRLEAPTAATTVHAALLAFERFGTTDLPVVDGKGKVWLELTHAGHARLLAALLGDARAPWRAPQEARGEGAQPHRKGAV